MRLSTCAALVALSVALPALGQGLTCTTSGSDRCAVVHYHVQEWSAETKQVTELYGINSFSSTSACEAARRADIASNQAAVDYLTRVAPRARATPNRYGPCHCDQTGMKSDPHYLDDDRRVAQLRTDRELRLQLMNLLVDNNTPADSTLVRALFETPRGASGSQWPRFVTPPAASTQKLLDPEHTAMKESTVTATSTAGIAGTKAELVEVKFDPTLTRAEAPLVEEGEGGNPFIDQEMLRLGTILSDAGSLPDSGDKERLLETLNRRTLMLSNLARLIESSGPRSALTAATTAATSDEARMALIRKLFGTVVGAHWSARKPSDFAFDVPTAINTDPVGKLRDNSGKVNADDRRLALYVFLSQNPSLTEAQEAWARGIIESMLKN